MYSNYMICENKKIEFKIIDANYSINIMKLENCWIKTKILIMFTNYVF